MATNSHEQSGIHARRIEADNVVSGTQKSRQMTIVLGAFIVNANFIRSPVREDFSSPYDFTCLALDKIQIIRKIITIK